MCLTILSLLRGNKYHVLFASYYFSWEAGGTNKQKGRQLEQIKTINDEKEKTQENVDVHYT